MEGNSRKEYLENLCRENKIKHELIPTNSREYNGVAELGLAMIESAVLAFRIQASKLFPGCSIPEGPSVLAEATNWVAMRITKVRQ